MNLQKGIYAFLVLSLIPGTASNADLLPDSVSIGISTPSKFSPEYPS